MLIRDIRTMDYLDKAVDLLRRRAYFSKHLD
jgi:hypothetical protein